jgi:tetratricopeptide (TPR) repeat protein
MEPTKPYGNFGMGQAYAKLGRYDESIAAFDRAIQIQPDYWEAYSEKGYALSDSGQTDLAQDMVTRLATKDTTLSALLGQYIYEHSKAKLTAVYSSSLYTSFPSTLGPKTAVSGLSGYLASANSTQTLAMEFQFSKQMDQASVENVFNWSIARSIGTARGDGYNMDMPLLSTEISLDATPQGVFYNPDTLVATVMFTVRQNSSANGTIDPSHIKFSFSGKDAVGLSMDTSADEYMGFSGFA